MLTAIILGVISACLLWFLAFRLCRRSHDKTEPSAAAILRLNEHA